MVIDAKLWDYAVSNIPQLKWILSQKEGYDVGVPFTVDHLLLQIEGFKKGHKIPDDTSSFVNSFPREYNKVNREVLIGYYLFAPQGKDEDKEEHLKGELYRFGRRNSPIENPEVEINKYLVEVYISKNRLSKKFKKNILNTLNLS